MVVVDDPWTNPRLCLSLAWQLALRQLRVRYQGSLLGYAWTMAYPLILLGAYALVFTTLFAARPGSSATAVGFCAVFFVWMFFSSVMSEAVYALSQASALLHQVYFPRWILPCATTLAHLVNFVVSIPVAVTILYLLGVGPTWNLMALVLLVPVLLVFGFGVALLISPLSLLFRDLQHIVGLSVTVLFFLSPVFYTLEQIAGNRWLHAIVLLNPFSPFLELSRACFTGHAAPGWTWLGCAVWAVVSWGVGTLVFRRFADSVAVRV